MRIAVVAIGEKMPAWVDAGVREYTQRFPREWRFSFVSLAPVPRTKSSLIPEIVAAESEKLMRATAQFSYRLALDERGDAWTSKQLAIALEQWQTRSEDVALMIGGADGLSDACRQYAQRRWSLSTLTFPHGLVRIILAEQLYRAWTLLANHPYHRE